MYSTSSASNAITDSRSPVPTAIRDRRRTHRTYPRAARSYSWRTWLQPLEGADVALVSQNGLLSRLEGVGVQRDVCSDASADLRATKLGVEHEDRSDWRQRSQRNNAREQTSSAWP